MKADSINLKSNASANVLDLYIKNYSIYIRFVLLDLATNSMLPDIFYLQLHTAQNNKNKFIFAHCAILVQFEFI